MQRLIACAVFSLAVLGPGVFYAIRASRMRSWPSVRGRVISSKLEWGGGGAQIYLVPNVRYAYHVQGREYEGTNLTMADWLFTAGWIQAKRYQRRFPVGREVLVYYNPEDHSKSVVVRPGFITAGIMVLAGIITFYVLWKFGPSMRDLQR